MTTVAITGATGLLGSTLMKELASRGLHPVALTSDIRDVESLMHEVVNVAPAWIVHTAAMTNVAECEKNPEATYAVNVQGTANVIQAAKEVRARVIYISTASVFKGDTGNYKEQDKPEATNVYNQTKIEGEQAALQYDKAMVLRLNLIGIHPNGSRGRNFLEWLVDSIAANKDLKLFNDQYINALSSWSIARMIVEIIENEIAEKILHIGTKDVVSKAGLAKLVLAHYPAFSGTVEEISVDAIHDGVSRPKHMWLSVDKASALLGTMPNTEEEVEIIWNKL